MMHLTLQSLGSCKEALSRAKIIEKLTASQIYMEPSPISDDPYNTELLDDDSDSESELEDTPVPIVTRTSNLERLEIDALVDLANPKLVAHYNESSQPVAVTQPLKPAQSHTWTAEWTNENWAARDLNF